MQGFTLIEAITVLFIITVLSAITLNISPFTKESLYLRNFVYKFSSNLNLLKDFSIGRRIVLISGQPAKVCGYGISLQNNKYFGYVYATTSVIECDVLALTNLRDFTPRPPIFYLHTNGEIRQNPIPTLVIKDDFLKKTSLDGLRVSLTSNTCRDNLFNIYPELSLIYYNPYGDLLVLDARSGANILPPSWDYIYLCFKYRGEERFLIINRSGQVLIKGF